MTSQPFHYEKAKVIQALRYHFITRKEIKWMMIAVNVFAIVSAGLFFWHTISPLAFLLSSLLWFSLMIAFWFLLPFTIYKKNATFRDNFTAYVSADGFSIENNRGRRSWGWNEFSTSMESPHFFHLYFDTRSFFILPKAAFPGDAEHEARQLLGKYINSKSN